MGAPFTTLAEIATEIVGGSSGAVSLGAIDSEWLKSGEFLRLLVLEDYSTARLVCSVKGYGPRVPFLTGSQTNIANGAQLVNHAGPVEAVLFVIVGGIWDGTHRGVPPRGADIGSQLGELSIENTNPTNNPFIRPHCVEDGNTIFHNKAGLLKGGASSVTVNTTFPLIPAINFAASNTLCSDEFAEAICLGALGVKFGHDGDRMSAAAAYMQRSDALKGLGLTA